RRWFGGKSQVIKAARVLEYIPVPIKDGAAFMVFVEVDYVQTEPEVYVLPLACAFGKRAEAVAREWPTLVLARVNLSRRDEEGVVYDAMVNKEFCKALLTLIASRRGLEGKRGELVASHTAVMRKLRIEKGLALDPLISKAEQSNSSVVYGNRLILKIFRK